VVTLHAGSADLRHDRPARGRWIGSATLLALALLSTPAHALDPDQRLTQYKHNRWTAENGAPTPISGLAQGKDGFLWITAAQSLYRFDGDRFEKIPVENSQEDHGMPLPVLVADNGDVWTWFGRSGRFAVYRQGALRIVPSPEIKGQVTRLVQTRDGAVWAAIGQIGEGLFRHAGGQWTHFGAEAGLPRDQVMGMVATRDGALWVSYFNSVVRLSPGGRRFETVLREPGSIGALTVDSAGRIWFSGRQGTRALTGPGGTGPSPSTGLAYPTDDSPRRARTTFDRDGNLWFALRQGGVQRLRAPDPRGAPSRSAAAARLETFAVRDGLTSNNAERVLEDREGNIWVVTSRGLDKFRPANIVVEPSLTRPAAYGDILMTAADGAVFVAQADTVHRIAPGGQPATVLRDMPEPEAMCQAPDGTVWIAFADRVLTWKNGTTRRLPHPPAETGLYACGVDRQGDVWFTAAGSGIYRHRAGAWESMFGPTSDEGFHPSTMIVDAKGRLVTHWSLGSIAWLDFPHLSQTRIDYGSAKPGLRTLYDTGSQVLAAGTFGMAKVAPDRFEAVSAERLPILRGVSGIVQTPQGDLWLASLSGVVRMRARDLDRAFADPGFSPPSLTLGFDDGLPDRIAADGWRTAVRGGDGRIWLSTEAGTVWLDPARIHRNTLPPPVVVSGLRAGNVFHRDPKDLVLPAHTSNIEIDYTALSLAIPERVRFRYRLEGFDKDWVDPGARRQAFYTNLPPGRYRFRVIAANNDGVWNNQGAVVAFEIRPAFVQSPWFVMLCAAAAAGGLWLLYRLRMAQVTQRVRTLLEERLGERERIARELHDTLLQSVQGLILRFQAVTDRLPQEEPARGQLEATLKRADDVMIEGRNRVRDLRLSEESGDLRGLIEKLVEDTAFDPPIPIRIVIEGQPRPVDTLVAAEIGRIVAEALLNIARHARATAVEIEIGFDRRELGLRIHDNGVGLDADVLSKGEKDGHFGLVGMRERAARIGGTLTIESGAGLGTDLTLTTPARLAFPLSARGRWLRFLTPVAPT
jgi:signal transduction histidine kinase/streptogramin lyase